LYITIDPTGLDVYVTDSGSGRIQRFTYRDCELAVDFGIKGLGNYSGSGWEYLTSEDVEWLAVYGSKLVGDLGAQWGLREYDGTSWNRLHFRDVNNSGNSMVAVYCRATQ